MTCNKCEALQRILVQQDKDDAAWRKQVLELQAKNSELSASINDLREALENMTDMCLTQIGADYNIEIHNRYQKAKQALAKTALQCLQEHDNEVIERCAETAYAFLDDPYLSGHGYATGCSDAILALKGKQNGN